MDNQNKTEFAGLMAMLDSAYDKGSDALKVNLYFNALKEFGIERVKFSVQVGIKTLKYYPTIADLMKIIQNEMEIEDRREVEQKLIEHNKLKNPTPEERENSDRAMIKACAAYWYWLLDDPKTDMALEKKAQGHIDKFKEQGYGDVLVEAKKFCDEVMKTKCPYSPKQEPVELTEKKRQELRVLSKRWRATPESS